MKDILIYRGRPHQLVMGADVRNTAVVQDYNLIRVPDRGNALRDNDLGYMRAFSAKSLIQRSFGLEVKSAGRVVKYQDLVLFNTARAMAMRCF